MKTDMIFLSICFATFLLNLILSWHLISRRNYQRNKTVADCEDVITFRLDCSGAEADTTETILTDETYTKSV